jgi:phosphoglycerol transferase MdoB-like AlkP superfamily enzyme
LVADVLVVGVIAGLRWAAFSRRRPASGRRPALAFLGAAIVLAIQPAWLIWRDPDEVFAYEATRREVAVAIGILPYHLYDAAAFAVYPVFWRLATTAADRERAFEWLDRHDASARRSPMFGAARGRNLIIVMCESLTRVPLGLTIDGQPITPNLSRFESQSLSFVNFFDQTHEGTTSDGEFTSLQSLQPLSAGAVAPRYGGNSFRGLPAVLQDHGYDTWSASAERSDFWNKRQIHPALGFSRSWFGESYAPGEVFGLGLADAEFFRQTMAHLREAKRPFFGFVMTLSNHYPFHLPERHRTLRLGAHDGTLLGDYLQSAHYFDAAFGELMAQLDAAGMLDDTVVAVYGDHQAFWGEVAGLASLTGTSGRDAFAVWRVRERLPFLIRLPGGLGAGRYERAGGHLDVAPTLLSLLGVDVSAESFMGQDLTAAAPAPFVVFRTADFIDGSTVCLREGSPHPAGTCYRLVDGAALADSMDARRLDALDALRVSDTLVRGNLVATMHDRLAARPAR